MTLDATTIVFALVAIFVCWRLYSTLGARSGAERPPAAPGFRPRVVEPGRPAPPPGPPAAERWAGVAQPGSAVARGLDAIAGGDPAFDAQAFLGGARGAYEMIIGAFAAGNVDALRPLLAPEPFANFSREIEARRAAGRTMSVTLVSVDRADIVEAGVQRGAGQITVKFASKMNTVTTDSSGAVVDGAAQEVVEHIDVWTFTRPLASRDPNWLLTATEAPH